MKTVEPVNVNGAGDALVATFVAALIRGLARDEAVLHGIAAGTLTVTSAATVDPRMSWKRVQAVVEKERQR